MLQEKYEFSYWYANLDFQRFILVSISDKNLSLSISGDVDEAKALSKPPEDSQGTDTYKYLPSYI